MKTTLKDYKQQLERAKDMIVMLEETKGRDAFWAEPIEAYADYLSLSANEKIELKKRWDDYYEGVRETKAYKRFKAQSQAFKQGKTKLAKAFGDKAREQRESGAYELVKPQGKDPEWILSNQYVITYLKLKNDIIFLQNQIKINEGEADGYKGKF